MTKLPSDHAFFLLTGPMASGKSTVARLLAQRFERGVHVEGDVFRRNVVAGGNRRSCMGQDQVGTAGILRRIGVVVDLESTITQPARCLEFLLAAAGQQMAEQRVAAQLRSSPLPDGGHQ